MKFRKPLKITSRTSTVTNSFVQAIIPCIEHSEDEVAEALGVLGMTFETVSCAYCGAVATDWDHLRPLVRKKRPTGYITEIRNLVPSCGPCNQSKSGADWQTWMRSKAPGSPNTKGIPDLDQRIRRLAMFEEWGAVTPLPLREIAGGEDWDAHWANLELLEQSLKEAQAHATLLRAKIQENMQSLELGSAPSPKATVHGRGDHIAIAASVA